MKVSYFAFMAAAMWACCGCSSEKSGDKPVADAKIGIRTSILDRSEMRTPSLDSNGSGSFADGYSGEGTSASRLGPLASRSA